MLKTQATGAIIQRIKQAPWGEASKGSYDKLAGETTLERFILIEALWTKDGKG
jgi:hypothetical protein